MTWSSLMEVRADSNSKSKSNPLLRGLLDILDKRKKRERGSDRNSRIREDEKERERGKRLCDPLALRVSHVALDPAMNPLVPSAPVYKVSHP